MNLTLEQKVDRVLTLLEGNGDDAPGLLHRVTSLERTINGTDRHMGLNTKTRIIWNSWVWILCTLSAAAGMAIQHFTHILQ